MAWRESEFVVMRSRLHAGTWIPVRNGSSEDALLNAGTLRLVQRFVAAEWADTARTRWRKLTDDLFVLDEWET
jgi:hypothetical protein